jgi:hypothetical protein
MERNSWNGSSIKSTHVTTDGDYPQAIRDLAAEKHIDLIDVTALTKAFFEKIGRDSTTKHFLNLRAGESPNYPEGNTDNTHLQERGAEAVSQLIADDIARQELMPLASWVNVGTTALSRSPLKASLSLCSRKSGPSTHCFDLAGRYVILPAAVNKPGSGVFLQYVTHGSKVGATRKVNMR